MATNWKLSPSDLTFLWEECKRCFYLKVVHEINRPFIMPKIFNKIDSIMNQYFFGKNTTEINPVLPPGTVLSGNWVGSRSIVLPGHTSTCYILGKFDTVVKFEDGSYGIIDFKTSESKSEHVSFYSRQLHAYAYALENAAPGKLNLSPVSKLGLLCVEPMQMLSLEDGSYAYKAEPTWMECPRDDKAFLGFLSEVLDVLERPEPPESTIDCPWCQYQNTTRQIFLNSDDWKMITTLRESQVVTFVHDHMTGVKNPLEGIVRESVGKGEGELTWGDVVDLTELRAAGLFRIAELGGIEWFTQLKMLDVGNNRISDLYPLSGLTQLTELDLWSNQIRDISPLAGLTQLQVLDVGNNQISDLYPLSGLTQLTELDLCHNQISDLSSLDGLSQLTRLDIGVNPLSDVAMNEQIPALEKRGVIVYKGIFADYALERAVEGAAGKPGRELTQEQLASLSGITQLWAGRDSPEMTIYDNDIIYDLAGIERLTQLTELNLWNNQISDLSPLSRLIQLRMLNLGGNQIRDISPLSGLTQLTELDLCYNQISDLSSLDGLSQLTRLDIGVNPISDLSPLSGLTQLTELVLGNNPLSDVAMNEQIPALEKRGVIVYKGIFAGYALERAVGRAAGKPGRELTQEQLASLSSITRLARDPMTPDVGIYGNKGISDLAGIERLTQLTELNLWNNQISDLSPLSRLIQLRMLNLGGNQIRDISPLSGLTQLTELDLCYNQISDLSSLDGLSQLTRLDIGVNPISDLSPLSGLTQLTELVLGNNPLSDVAMNEQIPALEKRGVIVYKGIFADYALERAVGRAAGKPGRELTQEQLASLSSITRLARDPMTPDVGIYGNKGISDLSGIEWLTQLRILDLWDNQISDLSPLSGLTQLTELDLSANQISDLSPLSNLTQLTELDLGNNQIRDISPLSGLTQLTELDLCYNQISDLSSLDGLSQLTRLDIGVNPISDLSPLSGLTQLTELVLGNNPLSDVAMNEQIPALEKRGVIVYKGIFAGYALERAVERAAGKPGRELTQEQLASLSSITRLARDPMTPDVGIYGNKGISDLSGIEWLTQLRILDLWDNPISDLSPLSGLTQLTELDLSANQISDLSPLSNLTQLTELDLGNNQISDLSPLVPLTTLTRLSIKHNPLSDVAINEQIPALESRGVTVLTQ